MMLGIFGVLTVLIALISALSRSMKTAILALWLTGILLGGVFLGQGAEMLAVLQWVSSTLISGLFVYFSMMFGEFQAKAESEGREPEGKKLPTLKTSLAVLIAAGFGVWVELGLFPNAPSPGLLPETGQDLANLGAQMVHQHFLSLLILAAAILLAMIGTGILARMKSEGGT